MESEMEKNSARYNPLAFNDRIPFHSIHHIKLQAEGTNLLKKVIQTVLRKQRLSVSMISSIKYISPALLFNKSFLKSYQLCSSSFYLIQSLWLYVDLVTNKFVISLVSIC